MGSKTATKAEMAAAREGGVVTYKGNGILSAMIAKGVAAAAPHTVPWALGAGLTIPAYALHELWGGSPWAAAGLTVSGGVVTAATWLVSRWRHVLGRAQSTGTAAAASGYLLAATITGPMTRPTIDLWIWAGGTLCALWNVRNIIRPKIDPDGTMYAVNGGAGALFKRLFTDGQERVEVEAVRNVKVGPTAIQGTVQLAGGDTAEDLQKALPGIEAEHGLPMGSLTATPNRHNAGQPTVTLTNPLVLENPIAWPGPSAIGGSVARPFRVALFQDGTPFFLELIGSHLQIMGMTGAAKTTAGAWGLWGEFVTREDGALIVVDITKGEQTVGPARPALHGAVTKKDTARRLFKEWLPAWAEERLADFGKDGLIAWQEGCGYSYLLVHLEEAADVFEHIDMAEFVNLARMLRSAGGGFVWSLQRADSTQMPTIVKGQGGGKVCFGVESSHDAGWGLTDAQEKAGARPEQWRDREPAMAYADTRGVTPDRIAMPQRWFDWGGTNDERVANFRAHCAAYPASARPVDKATAKLVAKLATPAAADERRPQDATEDNDVTSNYLKPDPELDAHDAANPVSPDAELVDVPDVPLGKGERMAPEIARAAYDKALQAFADGRPFAPRDLGHLIKEVGLARATVQKYLKADVQSGVLEYDDKADQPYRLRVLAGV
ncbi:hypothetical protein ABZU32_39075 [Sphaerisporangium sp. NPDC005288]|uniref:hypothetical protein n=1 Tax=Sphaerisporangium sp. NPDC005288 TaxID=3155114 RepID=UPI0033A51FCB